MKRRGKIKTEEQEKKDLEWLNQESTDDHNEIIFSNEVNPKEIVINYPKN